MCSYGVVRIITEGCLFYFKPKATPSCSEIFLEE